jgi:hypothetical protein
MPVNAFGNHELQRFDYRSALRDEVAEALFDANVLGAIDRHGFVVIEHAIATEVCDRLVTEMQPYIDATPHGLHGLGGTRRVGALVARSPTSHQMVTHPAILRLASAILGEQRLAGYKSTVSLARATRGFVTRGSYI